MTCEPHEFFLSDWKSNQEHITKQCGNNWKVKCWHCGMTLAVSMKDDLTKPVSIVWKNSVGWFGQFEITTN